MQRQLSDGDVRELRTLAANGETDIRLAVRFGITEGAAVAIRTGVKRADAGGPLTLRKKGRFATKVARERIRRALARGETHEEIAEREGCAPQTVARVANPVVTSRTLLQEVAALRDEVAKLRADVKRLKKGKTS